MLQLLRLYFKIYLLKLAIPSWEAFGVQKLQTDLSFRSQYTVKSIYSRISSRKTYIQFP